MPLDRQLGQVFGLGLVFLFRLHQFGFLTGRGGLALGQLLGPPVVVLLFLVEPLLLLFLLPLSFQKLFFTGRLHLEDDVLALKRGFLLDVDHVSLSFLNHLPRQGFNVFQLRFKYLLAPPETYQNPQGQDAQPRQGPNDISVHRQALRGRPPVESGRHILTNPAAGVGGRKILLSSKIRG